MNENQNENQNQNENENENNKWEEIEEEIEALEAIYMEDFDKISNNCFEIKLCSANTSFGEESNKDIIMCSIRFTLPSGYPDQLPLISIKNISNLDRDIQKSLSELLKEESNNNLGIQMIFSLCETAKTFLQEEESNHHSNTSYKGVQDTDFEEFAHGTTYEKTLIESGTPVTPDTFQEWNEKFLTEQAEFQKTQASNQIEKEKENKRRGYVKYTGRELFEREDLLQDEESVIKKTEETSVDIDWTLFHDD